MIIARLEKFMESKGDKFMSVVTIVILFVVFLDLEEYISVSLRGRDQPVTLHL